SPLVPKLDVSDAAHRPVPYVLLGNGDGTYSVGVRNVKPGATYAVTVSALDPHGSHATGAYALAAAFNGQPPTALQSFGAGTLTASGNRATQALTVGQNRLYEFALSANGAQAWTEVRMDVVGADGQVVFSLS